MIAIDVRKTMERIFGLCYPIKEKRTIPVFFEKGFWAD